MKLKLLVSQLVDQKKKRIVKDFLSSGEGTFYATKGSFNKMIEKFKKSGNRNYDFLTKSGKYFQNSVFKFCQRMYRE